MDTYGLLSQWNVINISAGRLITAEEGTYRLRRKYESEEAQRLSTTRGEPHLPSVGWKITNGKLGSY